MNRDLPMMKQLGALLALLVAALAGLPGAAAAVGPAPANLLADGGAARADIALPAAGKQATARAERDDDTDNPGDGGFALLPMSAAPAPEAAGCRFDGSAASLPQRRCASYRSRAPPAA